MSIVLIILNLDMLIKIKVTMTNEGNKEAKKHMLRSAHSFPSAFQQEMPAPSLSLAEIYALFLPHFGLEFTEWFIDQYKENRSKE